MKAVPIIKDTRDCFYGVPDPTSRGAVNRMKLAYMPIKGLKWGKR